MLLKLFFPSWRFFDEVKYEVCFEFRRIDSPPKLNVDWLPFFTSRKPMLWWQIFFNPLGNLRLAIESLANRAVDEIYDCNRPSDFRRSQSYELLKNAVEAKVSEEGSKIKYQFRLRMIELDSFESEVVLLSEIHQCQK